MTDFCEWYSTLALHTTGAARQLSGRPVLGEALSWRLRVRLAQR